MNTLDPNLATFIMLAIFFVCVVGIILIGVWIFNKSPLSKKQERIARFVDVSQNERDFAPSPQTRRRSKSDVEAFRGWINESLQSLSSEELQVKISSAYWPITDTEFILIWVSVALTAFILGWVIPGNILGGFLFGVVAMMTPRFILDRAIAQRQKKFHNQLLDALVLIRGAIQAGYSFMQALDLAVKEIPKPAAEEFGRVLREINLGLDLETSLFNLADRMESDDLQIVVTAIIINSQVGGNLSTVMEASISTIRDRMQLMGEIRSLTSYGRYVGYFLTMLPFFAGALIFMVSPDYFDTVKTSPLAQIIFLAAFGGIFIGNLWIRKIIQIKV